VEWGDLECITGREVRLEKCLREEYEAVLKHFTKVGWRVGRIPNTNPHRRMGHPYQKDVVLVFCPPSSSLVGRVRPANKRKLTSWVEGEAEESFSEALAALPKVSDRTLQAEFKTKKQKKQKRKKGGAP